MGKSSINGQFSMAMLNNQRVSICKYYLQPPGHIWKHVSISLEMAILREDLLIPTGNTSQKSGDLLHPFVRRNSSGVCGKSPCVSRKNPQDFNTKKVSITL